MHQHKLHWLCQISVLGLVCSILTFMPTFRSPKVRPLRAVLFGGFALSTLVPVVDGISLYG
jgi:adiponectin receptor